MIDEKREQLESILCKLNWAKEILYSAQESTDDIKTADILSGAQFIIDSASNDAQVLYQGLSE